MSLLNKESVKRVEKALKEFNKSLSIVELDNSATNSKRSGYSL